MNHQPSQRYTKLSNSHKKNRPHIDTDLPSIAKTQGVALKEAQPYNFSYLHPLQKHNECRPFSSNIAYQE